MTLWNARTYESNTFTEYVFCQNSILYLLADYCSGFLMMALSKKIVKEYFKYPGLFRLLHGLLEVL